ncbi:MAG TPA: carbohydrate ABC transporter permease [Candidatus Caccousia stercoris]|uniref:Carbohydrate ABC transporter permease n=1 Tax=Candidatus Caccousia stercoris TaxID=2840723 RepID=A0A9D1FRY7_9FIRM|nr:carbohydrate ABC transporter permease [Candidatus Caccousia stercoris]
MSLITIYPFYYVLIVSFSNVNAFGNHVPYLLPYVIDFEGYKVIFADFSFLQAFFNSVFVTVVGSLLNMLLSICGAYALSKKRLVGRGLFLSLILFTMLFSGGLIPYYLVVSGMGLTNSLWSMILPTAINTFYLIIMKNYFVSLPPSLEEAAKIDGAHDLTILFRIILPISMPFIATFFLFYAVERWNEWWNALLFINEKAKQPLQIYMRELLVSFNSALAQQAISIISQNQKANFQSIQMATIVVSTVPILCVYPFIQKHFVKGVMVGSVKE